MGHFAYTLNCDNKIIDGTIITVEAKNESAAFSKVTGLLDGAHNLGNATLSPPYECKCDLRTQLVGDGCMACNPDRAADLM